MTPEQLGAVVRARRRQLRLRQQDLADLCGVGRRFVVDLEAGGHGRDPGLHKVLEVCAVLGLDLTVTPARGPEPTP